jgi:hypothetical protein
MLMFDLALCALVGSLYGAIATKAEKVGTGMTNMFLAMFGYAVMTFSASAGFVFVISANLGK